MTSRLAMARARLFLPVRNSSTASSTPGRTRFVRPGIDQFWADVLRSEEEALRAVRPWEKFDFFPVNGVTLQGDFLHKDYDFSVPPASEEQLEGLLEEWQATAQLRYPFGPAGPCPEGVDPREWAEAFGQARLFLLGTSPMEKKAAAKHAARSFVREVRPDVVVLGIPPERAGDFLKSTAEWDRDTRRGYAEAWEQHQREFERENGGRRVAELGTWAQLREDWNCRKMRLAQRVGTSLQLRMTRRSEFYTAIGTAKQDVLGCAGFVFVDQPAHLVAEAIGSWQKQLEGEEEAETLSTRTRTLERLLRAGSGKAVGGIAAVMLEEYIGELARKQGLGGKWRAAFEQRNRHFVRVLFTLLHRLTVEKFYASQRIGADFQPVNAIAVVAKGRARAISELWTRPEQVYAPSEQT